MNYKSPKRAWEGLPKDKSLFTTKTGYGLPIGNLTSQVFANFYLTEFEQFLKEELGLTLHPKKIYLQPAKKWSSFSWCLHKAKLHNGRKTCSEKLSKHYRIEKSAIKIEKKK